MSLSLKKTRSTSHRLFDDAYEVILADTEVSRVIHRKIRYHVYCLERRFEDHTAFASGEECDRWDAHAAQFVVRQRASGQWIAAMRLILPHAASFPLETLHCLTPNHAHQTNRRKLAEISRLCIIRLSDPHTVNPHLSREFGHVTGSRESQILLGLIRTIIIYGLEWGIEHCYLLVTASFARLLHRIGVILHQAGTATEHRGLRIPYLMGLRETGVSLCARSVELNALFARAKLAYRPFSALDEENFVPMPRFLPLLSQNGPTATRPYNYLYQPLPDLLA